LKDKITARTSQISMLFINSFSYQYDRDTRQSNHHQWEGYATCDRLYELMKTT
jgi:hypothetical protein